MESIKEIEAIIEAVLFTAGDPVPLEKLSDIIGHDKKTTKNIMTDLIFRYKNASRGIMIREINKGYQFCTKPEYNDYIAKLGQVRKKQGLTSAAYEVLAIVAYNQPVTKAYIEKIRGVNSDSALSTLIDRNLIKEAGRDDGPGRPKLYETTEEFLRVFGFASIQDLPVIQLNEIQEVMENMPLD